jgi:hypothetical protein
MMVINRHPIEQGSTLPLAGLHHRLGEALLYASNHMGLLLIIMLISASLLV